MKLTRSLPFFAIAALGFGACDSKVETVIDTELLARVETVQDCFPNLYQWVDALLEVANTWRLQDGAVADPAGLNWTANGGGVDVTFLVNSTTVSMAIRFYGPSGALQNLATEISTATTLAEVMDLAATELRDRFPTGDKFIHGVWSISGGGISATGEGLTGVIGGSTNANELAVLSTTDATVSGGIPATDPSTVTDNGPPVCILTFSTDGLYTDEEVGQEYPRGVVSLELVGPDATVTATVTFNKTATATVRVDDIPGSFDLNLLTREITYRR